MSRYHSYLNSATEILRGYNGSEPFAGYIKKHFSNHKKHGSADRKNITHLCYCYFRLGKAVQGMPVEKRILLGLYLCSPEPNPLLENLKPLWNDDKTTLPISRKIENVNYITEKPEKLTIEMIFPWSDQLSAGIEKEAFVLSHFQQPDLFLRTRPGYEKIITEKIQKAGIEFRQININCLALPNSSKLENVIELNKEVVVQDYNSQRTGEFIPGTMKHGPWTSWDCCAGSGGKSIMIYDFNPQIELTVSDSRESIIINLRKRFKEAGIKKYQSFVADLTVETFHLQPSTVNLILADVPCTGSGTWSRTPEQLYYFKEEKIRQYAALQQKIVSAAVPNIGPGGYLLYSTCSVFREENEEIINFIKDKFQLQLVKMELLKGYELKADTLFAALLKKEVKV